MAARDRVTELYPETDSASNEVDLASLVRQSQDVLLKDLREQYERLVDAFVRYRLGSNDERSALLEVLFELHDEGLLSKAEVRRRGRIEPEDYYDELHAFRVRRSAR